MGRFLSPDFNGTEDYTSPVPYADLSIPQTLNLYAFAGNNPLSNVDPDGHNYTLCDMNGNNCQDVTDDQYNNWLKANPNISVSASGQFYGTDADGNSYTAGTASYYNEQDQQGAAMIGFGGMGMVNGFMKNMAYTALGELGGAAMGAGVEALQASRAAGAAGAAVDVTNLSAKIVKDMARRGWTADEITQTVENGTAHAVTNKATGGGATEFINPANGKFVVVDNDTRQVLLVSGPGFSPNHLVP